MTKNIFKDVFTLSLFFYSFWIDGDKISVYARINFIAMQRYREGFDTLYEMSDRAQMQALLLSNVLILNFLSCKREIMPCHRVVARRK